MKCMRRPDIDTVARVTIAVQAFLGLGVYGEITRIARFYQVSRLFVYKLLWQLLALSTLEVCDPLSAQAIRKEVARYILLLRLEGHCSLEAISHILKQLGLPFSSIGYISQRLATYARALPHAALSGSWGSPMLRSALLHSGSRHTLARCLKRWSQARRSSFCSAMRSSRWDSRY